jgi:hypothetical protein
MTTKVDVMKGIEAVDARVNQMTPQLLTNGTARLPEGEWQEGQVLCHLAARANSVPIATTAAQRMRAARDQGQSALARSAIDIDEMNQQQIESRQNRSIQELVDEIHAGHQAALQAVREFDPRALEERLPAFTGGGDMSFADLVLRAGPGHENHHLDQIEKAMGG